MLHGKKKVSRIYIHWIAIIISRDKRFVFQCLRFRHFGRFCSQNPALKFLFPKSCVEIFCRKIHSRKFSKTMKNAKNEIHYVDFCFKSSVMLFYWITRIPKGIWSGFWGELEAASENRWKVRKNKIRLWISVLKRQVQVVLFYGGGGAPPPLHLFCRNILSRLPLQHFWESDTVRRRVGKLLERRYW